ncbi:GNAT family N-acetyltransferase [Magnetococcus sp. PR-3]|uniref:GNAT family N-acetyltransferase n=1 Tax=Magnetococcus sp. PR-3 TaxID=3120355 RepID=UPI002FCE4335
MDEIEFVDLFKIDEEQIMALMTHEQVGKQLPLLGGRFGAQQCRTFLNAKKRLWDQYGFGPQGIMIQGEFAGWGGLQPEHGEADFALILHPKFWGWGPKIFSRIKEQAFHEMKLDSITILLPPSRANSKAVKRLGFVEEGPQMIEGKCFTKYRLNHV